MQENNSDADSKEARILKVMKQVLVSIIRDTTVPPEVRHPLSASTIEDIKHCLTLISSRENELLKEAGFENRDRPRFTDEPQDSVVVSIDSLNTKKPD